MRNPDTGKHLRQVGGQIRSAALGRTAVSAPLHLAFWKKGSESGYCRGKQCLVVANPTFTILVSSQWNFGPAS